MSDAREVDREFAVYSRSLLTVMARQSLVVVLGAALLGWVQLNTLWSPNAPRLLLPMASGEVFLAGAAIVAGFVGALQFMTRSVGVDRERFRTLARRRFFSGVAHGLIAASVAIGLYGAYSGLSVAPGGVDLVRVFGPLCIGLLLAIFAGDAAIGEDERVDSDVMRLHNRESHLRQVRNELTFYTARVRLPRRRSAAWGVATLAVPVVVVVAVMLARPAPLWLMLVRAAVSAVGVITVYSVVYQALRCVARQAWITLSMWIVLPMLIAILLCLEAAQATLLLSTAENYIRRMILIVGGLIAIGLFTTAVALVSIATLRGQPGALRSLAILNANRRVARLAHTYLSDPKPPIDGVAIASLWALPLIPVGAVLGVLSLIRLSQATRMTRGRNQALAAIIVTGSLILMSLAALVVIWLLNPR